MKIKDLKPNKRNPRKISDRKLGQLKKSLAKYGDLSGFVFNRQTGELVSGHQRSKVLPADAKIVIEKKFETPSRARTVAEGFVEIEGERFKYREVDADETWAMEAVLAANKHGGEWDQEILRLAIADLPAMDLDSAGFAMDEIEDLKPMAAFQTPVGSAYTDHFDDADREEETDEEYLENNPGPDSSLPKENIDMVNRDAFESIEEKTESKLQKILVVIECDSQDGQKRLKEKLRTEEFNLGQYGAKMY